MKSIKDLKKHLEVVIYDNLSNMKLVQSIVKALAQKGMNTNYVYEIFNEEIELDDLSQVELFGLTKYMCDYLEDSKLNVDTYFTNQEKEVFEVYVETHEDKIDKVEIDDVRKINDREYECCLTYKQLYELRKNRLLGYNKDIQRASKISKFKGRVIKKINADKNNIKDLTKRFTNQDIKTTTIHLTPLLKEGKTPLFKFDDYIKKDTFGKITYQPVFDVDSENYCPFYIPDGYHRYTACVDAYMDHLEKTGQELKGQLNVLIQIMDIDEGRQFVSDVFKRSETDTDWTESLAIKNDSVVNDLIKKTDILKENVADTYAECVEYGKLTYKTIIDEALKLTEEDFANVTASYFYVEKMAKNINIITSGLKSNNIDISMGYIVGLIAVADKYKDEEKGKIIEVTCNIISKNEEIQKLPLKNKSINVKNVYNKFIELV